MGVVMGWDGMAMGGSCVTRRRRGGTTARRKTGVQLSWVIVKRARMVGFDR